MKKYKLSNSENILSFIVALFGAIVLINNIVYNYPKKYVVLTAWVVIFVSLYLLIIYRRKWEFFFIFFLMLVFNYSIMITEFISPITDILYTKYHNTVEAHIAQNLILFYLILLCVFMPRSYVSSKNIKSNIYMIPEKSNNLIVYVIAVVLIYILIFEYQTPEAGQRGELSPLYEYSVIFFIIGFSYSKQRTTNLLLTFILLLFVAQDFIFGGRITGLQLLVIWFLMNYSYRAKMRIVLPIMIAGFVGLSIIGATRGNYSDFESAIENVYKALVEGKLANDTSYAAFHTSVTFIKYEIFGWNERIRIFKRFLLSMIVGGSVPDSSLPIVTSKHYIHSAGGMLPMHFHYYMGWFGIVIAAAITGIYMHIVATVNEISSPIIKCIAVYFVAGFSRWYLYSPSNLLRGCTILCVVYFVFAVMDGLIKKHRLVIKLDSGKG